MHFYSVKKPSFLGLIYLPAVVACGYYFEKRRALATGISVCGSGKMLFTKLMRSVVDVIKLFWTKYKFLKNGKFAKSFDI